MTYAVVNVFLSIQGEGLRAGRRAVFVRFAGCNLWSGDVNKRAAGAGACAMWCDTDFVEGVQHYEAADLAALVEQMWVLRAVHGGRYVVLTGGEPLLQADLVLVNSLWERGFSVAVETNGTVLPKAHFDWTCVSPKLKPDGSLPELVVKAADELKVVLPGMFNGRGWDGAKLRWLENAGDWGAKIVMPQDPVVPTMRGCSQLVGGCFAEREYDAHMQFCVEWVKGNADWRLGVQLHKLAGLV